MNRNLQRWLAWSFLTAAFCLATLGCSSDRATVVGKVVRNGAPVEEGANYLVVTFLPVMPDGSPPDDQILARSSPDGSFRMVGRTGKGILPGKYRVTVELRNSGDNDTLGGAFGRDRTPFVFDLRPGTQEIVLDIGNPQG